ncbi:MAG: tRNA (N6-isopentenyl adenosine(37)-C2)-methylthiotransferase MiaB [Candidatus Melainabacteria bacterium]|nr:tRNA (N6-isopentenyl adenosine(37)-C2)-methylthiotransferase MiaB [Candidatus Melainabacteria bacterium]
MKHVYIETFGCQMNKADSEHMLGLLDEINYRFTEDIDKADLVLFNTCTIRESANHKFYSQLGCAGSKKKQRSKDGVTPPLLIGVSGCVAQDKKNWLQNNFPYVDIVLGTNNIHMLPEFVKKAERGERVCEIEDELPLELPELPVIRQTKITAWVNVILGCNFNCTYCIVPHVRGRERSRSPEDILREVKTLALEGFKEVTLLGQNVTAYGYDLDSNYSKEKATFGFIPINPQYSLGKLIRYIHDVEGIERIRFLTGHPFHVTDELIDTVSELPKACEYFHIPMQSGDNAILKSMARVYSVEKYKQMVEKIRTKMPNAAITSDFIVGFPGETEKQFLNTVKIVQEIEFDACNTAAYSPRPNTPSASWEKQVPEEEKNSRIRYLNSVVNEVLEKKNKKYLNTVQEILVEGRSTRDESKSMGRMRTNTIVNFDIVTYHGKPLPIGNLVSVKITKIRPWALYGEIKN